MTLDIREHGSKDDPNYGKYHPDSGGSTASPAAVSAWSAPLDADVAAAVAEYSDLGYISVNEWLREGTRRGAPMSAYNEDVSAQTTALVERMRAALRPTPDAIDLYRGTTRQAFPTEWDVFGDPEKMAGALSAHIGEVVSDAAFLSTSTTESTLFYLGGQIQLQLHAPAGTPSINTGGEAKFGGEKEIILGPGTKWRIDSVELGYGQANRGTPAVRIHGTVVP